MKVLFQRPDFGRGLGWDGLAPLLPGWQIDWCEPDQTAEHLDGADVICPSGVPLGGLTGHMFYRSGELFAGNLWRWAGEAPRWAVNAPPSLRGPGQAS